MGISRDSLHKRRLTGGKQPKWRKKRKYELGRQPANTKLVSSANINNPVRRVRVRGGNFKFRALRLDAGNFSWGSEAVTRKCRIVAVVYNASDNDLVRTNTLVKNAIVQVDSSQFRQWYSQHYGVEVGLKRKIAATVGEDASQEEKEKVVATETEPSKKSKHVQRKLKTRNQDHKLDPALEDQFSTGRLFACISSRPGQCGRADGYILEGKELEFYNRRMQRRKAKSSS